MATVMENLTAVMVAPNSARIRVTILRAEPSPQFPEKWLLEVEIRSVRALSGPQRAQPGMRTQAFTVRAGWDLPLPVEVEADAEYVGGPRQGSFLLRNLRVCP